MRWLRFYGLSDFDARKEFQKAMQKTIGGTLGVFLSRSILIESKRNVRNYNKIEEEVMKKADTEVFFEN